MIYTPSLAARRRLEEAILPSAKNVRDDSSRLFQSGETDLQSYLSAQSEYDEVAGDYLKVVIRHRRAALALNTAVGNGFCPGHLDSLNRQRTRERQVGSMNGLTQTIPSASGEQVNRKPVTKAVLVRALVVGVISATTSAAAAPSQPRPSRMPPQAAKKSEASPSQSPLPAVPTVNVLCVDADGKPVPGAEVHLYQRAGAGRRALPCTRAPLHRTRKGRPYALKQSSPMNTATSIDGSTPVFRAALWVSRGAQSGRIGLPSTPKAGSSCKGRGRLRAQVTVPAGLRSHEGQWFECETLHVYHWPRRFRFRVVSRETTNFPASTRHCQNASRVVPMPRAEFVLTTSRFADGCTWLPPATDSARPNGRTRITRSINRFN